jgi:crotonobetainyl-CoA:carnitine CoA-transferase CaiB-like acyl-CoA transferase
MMDEKKIVGLAVNEGYAKWAHKETRPEDIFQKPEALDNLLVLDTSYGSFAGLFASSILAETGARVIRIEPPGGDIARKMSPYGIMVQDAGLPYLVEARNKFHITLTISEEEGKDLFHRFIEQADVLIETFRPGYLDSLGLGYRHLKEINPSLVYCSIHSYGQFGTDARKHGNQPDYDIIDQARGVIMSVTGEPELDGEVPEAVKKPLKHGNWMGWYAGGAWAAFGIHAALFYRQKSGKGQFIDCAPPEGLMAMSNYVMQYFHATQNLMPRAGNYDYAVFPYTYEKCKDGYTFIGAYSDTSWAALCDIMDRPDLLTRFPTPKERLMPENQPTIQHEIEKFTIQYTSDELLDIITEYDRRPDRKGAVVLGRLESPMDVLDRDHWVARKTFTHLNDPHYGEVLVQNSSFKAMSRTPGRVKWACRPVGADNRSIYEEYAGLDARRLAQLKKRGVL